MQLTGHGRYDYRAINNRSSYDWPGGQRLAVYLAINVEHFAFGEGLGAELGPSSPQPDVLNYAWRDYGNRVGVWRLLDLLEELSLPSSCLINTAIYDYCPEVVEAFRQRGDEIVAHGRSNAERQGELAEGDEAALIRQVSDIISHHEGWAPVGWLGPWISQSRVTPDLLQEAGYSYLLDWCMDDQPIWFRTRNGRILAVPYPQELNDIPAVVARKIEGDTFADMIVAQFDEMLMQAEQGPLVMGIALHPYIVGQPFRLRWLRRALQHIVSQRQRIWLTRSGEIAEYCMGLPPGMIP